MSNVLGYVLAIGVAAGVAALGLEQFAVHAGRPRRAAWVLAMVMSLLLPPVLLLGTPARQAATQIVQVPSAIAIQASPAAGLEDVMAPVVDEVARGPLASAPVGLTPVADSNRGFPLPRPRTLLVAWAALSAFLLAGLATITLLQQRRAAAWARMSLLDHDVLVSDDTGPALVGVLRPRIVVPRWFIDEEAQVQALILEHERQHQLARDPLLLRAGLLAAVLVPWNLPLWWQWRRLRLAIEMDCDARVLGSGADAVRYGEVLLGVVRRAAAVPVGVVAMGEPASALELRIRNLLGHTRRQAIPVLVGATILAVAGVMAMLLLRVPALPLAGDGPDGFPQVVDDVAVMPVADPAQQAVDAGSTSPAATGTKDGGGPIAVASQAAPPRPAPAIAKEPRLPPPAAQSVPEQVLRALVARYPDVATGAQRPGIIEAAIVINPDGTVHRSALRNPGPRNPAGSADAFDEVMPREAGPATTAMLKQGTIVPGGATLKSSVALRYQVLPDDYDHARAVEVVQSAIVAARPDLLLPRGGERVNRVTVYMTADGRVDRLYNEPRDVSDLRPVPPVEAATWSPIFEPLGLEPEQLGRMGMTYAYARRDGDRMVAAATAAESGEGGHWIIVRYAWPRRANEPVGGFQAALRSSRPPDIFDAEAAQAIVQRHLPDVFAPVPAGLREPGEDAGTPAIALDASGRVLLATRIPARYGMSPEAVRELQSQLPGHVHLTRFVARPVMNSEGAGSAVLFAWDVGTTREGN